MKDIKIRPFISGEERVVASIHNAAFEEWIEFLGKEYNYRYIKPEDVSAWVKENHVHKESLWIAEVDGKAVGYAHCRLELIRGKRDFNELLFVHTDRDMGQSKIAVIPPYRRLGVAKTLIQKIVEHFEDLGADLAVVVTYSDNNAAEELLRRLGFVHKDFFYYKPYSETKPWHYDTVYVELNLSEPIKPVRLNLDVNVRPAGEEDAKDIAEIFRKSAPWSPFGPKASLEQALSYLKSSDYKIILVAEYKGKVVGVMDFNGNNYRLGIPGVLPEYRKKGIGYTLFYHLLENIRQKGFPKAIADTGLILSDAIRMYSRFGFKVVRRQHHWIKILHNNPSSDVSSQTCKR